MEHTATSRLEAFSDGIFAIAATLLVLELGVGANQGGHLGRALLDLWPSYLAYATSFLTIGIVWSNHHACFELIGRADRTLMFLNLLLLMDVSLFPFPTKLVGEYLQKSGEQAAVYAYVATLVLMSLLFQVFWRYVKANRRLIGDEIAQERVDAITRAFAPGPFIYGAAFVVAIFSPLAAVALTFAIAAFYVPSAALFNR